MHADDPQESEPGSACDDTGVAEAIVPVDEAAAVLPAVAVLAAAPIARQVPANADDLAPLLAYARPGFPVIRWWRALLEAAAPLAAAVISTIVAAPILFVWDSVDERWATVLLTGVGGLTAVLVCLGLIRLCRHPLASIGWTSHGWLLNVSIGVTAWLTTAVALLVLSAIIVAMFPAVREHQEQVAEAMNETFPKMSLAGTALFMAFVAVWEEIAFRGFMLTRLRAAFRSWWLAIPVGSILFGLCHVYEGPMGVIQVTLLGVVMGLLFWWRKSLVPGMVFHTINNVVAVLMLDLWTSQQAHS